jgi:hypothetical protein
MWEFKKNRNGLRNQIKALLWTISKLRMKQKLQFQLPFSP